MNKILEQQQQFQIEFEKKRQDFQASVLTQLFDILKSMKSEGMPNEAVNNEDEEATTTPAAKRTKRGRGN